MTDRGITLIFCVHESHIWDKAWTGHLHSNSHIQCKTQMQISQC